MQSVNFNWRSGYKSSRKWRNAEPHLDEDNCVYKTSGNYFNQTGVQTAAKYLPADARRGQLYQLHGFTLATTKDSKMDKTVNEKSDYWFSCSNVISCDNLTNNSNQRPQDRCDCTYREWRQFEGIYRGQPAPQTLLDHQTGPTSCPLSAPQLDPLNAIQIKFNK